ncbi:hypothetical protein SLEP1_g933 [Rubroshorea leprosula]|uniref:Uncharacterized protein n=1 Tax=Rubroshorea leprosula TaxID=152421 RepID=A0AAV5HJ65_9ROSI|nr:hypothetical protein SLEP1_g933 [Rubroshorea leprosula]
MAAFLYLCGFLCSISAHDFDFLYSGDITALHYAAKNGHRHACKYLVEEVNLNIDVKDDYGRTPLHYACLTKNCVTAAYLLQRGANPNAKTIMWRTPLHHAVEEGPLKLLKLLIYKGAEINALAECGTPLALAVIKGQKDFVKFLLDKDADPNAISDSLSYPLLQSVLVRDFECMELLLKAGADPNLRCTKAMTPLWNAAYQGWVEAIECLLHAGADPNFTCNDGMKPIEIAALKGSRQGVRILFPLTSEIPTIPDWSEDGIFKHVWRAEAEAEKEQKLEENFLLWKSRGTEAFHRKDYFRAIKWYQEAYYCKQDAAVVSNISLCWACLNEGGRALEAAHRCHSLSPKWLKAYYREGAAFMLLKQFDMAAGAFYNAWKMDPANEEIERAFRNANEALRNSVLSEWEATEAQKNKLHSEREAIEVEANTNGLHSSSEL